MIKKKEFKYRGKKSKEERSYYYNLLRYFGYSVTSSQRIRDWSISKINLVLEITHKNKEIMVGI